MSQYLLMRWSMAAAFVLLLGCSRGIRGVATESVADQRGNVLLRHVALLAEVASGGDVVEHLATAVDVVRRADRNRLRERGLLSSVAVQALIEVLVDLVAVDAVRNDRWLGAVVALDTVVVVDLIAEP